MKSKKLAVFLLTLVLTLGLFPMSVFASTTPITNASTASITIENAVESDVLSAYKVIDITYDATSNQLTYAWNGDFANYFSGTTVKDFAALNEENLKNQLTGLPAYIADNNIAAVKTATVAADGTATFDNLAMGEYFIRPTSSTSVYQLMLQKVEPTVVAGEYKIDDVTFIAKKEEVTITKTADKTSVTKNEKVAYTVTVDIPTYAANTTDKSFYVSDLLPDGLTIDTNSIKVQIDDNDVETTAYNLDKIPNTTTAPHYTFKLNVTTEQYSASWSDKGGKKLVITYTATLNNDNTTAVNAKETNTATFDYSYYPYAADTHNTKNVSVDVNTFAIKIDKFVEGSSDTKLAKAKFDLYRTATQAEIDAGTSVEIPHTNIKGIKLEGDLVTDDNGSATFAKYEANGTKYDYYLVETRAPSGYNILTNAVKVNFTDADVAGDKNGVYTVEVSNKSGFKLPITGGEGTVLFTVLGIAFMGGAVFMFIISRRKSKANSKK